VYKGAAKNGHTILSANVASILPKNKKKNPDSSVHSISLLSATLSKNPKLPYPNLKLYTTERCVTNSDVQLIHTRAKRNNINTSERYEYVTLHMNNRSDRLAFANGSMKDLSSLKLWSPTSPYLMGMEGSFLAVKHSLRETKHLPI